MNRFTFCYFYWIALVTVNCTTWRCLPNQHYVQHATSEHGAECSGGRIVENGLIGSTNCPCNAGFISQLASQRGVCIQRNTCATSSSCVFSSCGHAQTCFNTATGPICRDSGCALMRCVWKCVDGIQGSFCVVRGNRPETCFLSSSVGHNPHKSIPRIRFFYNPVYAACQSFYYAGFGGNDNNFETIPLCMDACYDQSDHQ